MARGASRVRRTQFSQSIQSGGASVLAGQASEMLRPTQKSVQAIRSRATLVHQRLTQARAVLTRGGHGVVALMARLRPGAAGLREKVGTLGSAVGRLRPRWRNRASAALVQEPDIDALFAPAAPAPITTRVVDTAMPAQPAMQPLHVVHHKAAPPKKMSVLQRAQAALHEKNYHYAEGILVDHIVHHTKDTKAYMLLGQISLAKTDWTEAMEIFEQVVHLQPHEPGAQAGLGMAAYNCGRYSKALPALQRAHEEDPRNRTVLSELLAIAQKMDNPALQRSIQGKLGELTAAERATSQAVQP